MKQYSCKIAWKAHICNIKRTKPNHPKCPCFDQIITGKFATCKNVLNLIFFYICFVHPKFYPMPIQSYYLISPNRVYTKFKTFSSLIFIFLARKHFLRDTVTNSVIISHKRISNTTVLYNGSLFTSHLKRLWHNFKLTIS